MSKPAKILQKSLLTQAISGHSSHLRDDFEPCDGKWYVSDWRMRVFSSYAVENQFSFKCATCFRGIYLEGTCPQCEVERGQRSDMGHRGSVERIFVYLYHSLSQKVKIWVKIWWEFRNALFYSEFWARLEQWLLKVQRLGTYTLLKNV